MRTFLKRGLVTAASLLCLALPSAGHAKEESKDAKSGKAKGKVQCTMAFELRSWAVFYKSGKGEGTITCSNGQKADVKIRTHGGGVQFGKNNIANGSGKFSPVKKLEELYGKYASVGGHGGAVKSRIGQSLSKDDISLNIKGTGTGVNFGFDFGSLRISPMSAEDKEEWEEREREEAEKEAKKQADEAKKAAEKKEDAK
ncbi:hypothetical protein FBR05_04890 [Deltaproteobacteria bacterium PRO3]|nr:hypothetical protein [Deltaproteobacteria bacterium PRO3]